LQFPSRLQWDQVLATAFVHLKGELVLYPGEQEGCNLDYKQYVISFQESGVMTPAFMGRREETLHSDLMTSWLVACKGG
jgi:hypothetical protein